MGPPLKHELSNKKRIIKIDPQSAELSSNIHTKKNIPTVEEDLLLFRSQSKKLSHLNLIKK